MNTLIQGVDDLRRFGGRIVVFLCTNRLSVLDPALQRRAAIVEEFTRPDDSERQALLTMDLKVSASPRRRSRNWSRPLARVASSRADLLRHPHPAIPGGVGPSLSRPSTDAQRFDRCRKRAAAIARHGGQVMPRSALYGRRLHITGSIVEDANIATVAEVTRAREFVKALVLTFWQRVQHHPCRR